MQLISRKNNFKEKREKLQIDFTENTKTHIILKDRYVKLSY